MQKFLAIPVTNEAQQLVAINGIVLVEQASTTTVTISYEAGQVVTITHAAEDSGGETSRDAVENAIVEALQRPWNEPVYKVDGLGGRISMPLAVSGISATYDTVSFDTGSVISVTADTTLTANQSGATVLLDAVGEDITLPANATGPWKFKFISTADTTSTPWQILAATADTVEGVLTVDGAAVPLATVDGVEFTEAASTAGDYIEVFCDGTTVFVTGVGEAATSLAAVSV